MEKKEDLLENFKTAIASTVKSISNVENIEVIFGNQNIKTDKKIIKLPDLENVNKKINYARVRALADSEALKVRFSKDSDRQLSNDNITSNNGCSENDCYIQER